MNSMDALWNIRQENGNSCATKSILVVESNSALRNLLSEILQAEMAYQIMLAPSARAALDILQTVTPQLFLVDACLSDMSGLELVTRLRSMQIYQQTPILLMSETPPKFHFIEPYLRCLKKPFALNKLLQSVTELLAIKYQRPELQ